ncbi:MAG: hypothetical protein Q7T11_03710 [Deltaproteobacteria bacterium]|nr:hypothetical protein [Deltaproteobacteria bacterium]
MKIATTIQISPEEDREIIRLKKALHFPTKKAVVMAGIQKLEAALREDKRRRRLQEASRLVREESLRANLEWSPFSTITKIP